MSHRRNFIFALAVTLLSIAGMLVSVHLVDMHYKKPGRTLLLFERYPQLEFLREKLPDKYLMDEHGYVQDTKDIYELDDSGSTGRKPYADSPDKFCRPGIKGIDCGCVDMSAYSEMFGIGVAVYGVAGYLMLIFMGIGVMLQRPARPSAAMVLIWLFSLIGFLYSLVLTGIEQFVIHCYCLYCVASALIMFALVVISAVWSKAPWWFIRRKKAN